MTYDRTIPLALSPLAIGEPVRPAVGVDDVLAVDAHQLPDGGLLAGGQIEGSIGVDGMRAVKDSGGGVRISLAQPVKFLGGEIEKRSSSLFCAAFGVKVLHLSHFGQQSRVGCMLKVHGELI